MSTDDTRRALFARSIELQGAINDLAAEYFAEMDRQAKQAERFGRLAAMFEELRKARRLLVAAGNVAPDLLTSEAGNVEASLERNSYFTGETIPPADCSAN